MRHIAILILWVWSCAAGCARYQVEENTPVAAFTGEFCTLNQEEFTHPVKVLFVLDNSGSMTTSDYHGRRKTAVREFARKYMDRESLYVGVTSFNDTSTIVTPQEGPFVNDLDVLDASLDAMSKPFGFTSYYHAMFQAQTLIERDIRENPGTASRTTYIVNFLSDGGSSDDPDLLEDVFHIIQQIRSLEDEAAPMGVGRATVNTSLLKFGSGAPLEDLLEQMSSTGGGTYQFFEKDAEIDFTETDISVTYNEYELFELLVSNTNVLPTKTGIAADADADGLSDEWEIEMGSNPLKRDSDDDGCGDRLEYELGWPLMEFPSAAHPHCECSEEARRSDDDGDGLTNCEEQFTFTSPFNPDTDGDGFIDRTELLFGMRPLLSDAGKDVDQDGTNNGDEVKQHRNPLIDDSAIAKDYAYDIANYENTERVVGDRTCYNLEVNNLHVLPLGNGELQADGTEKSVNRIEILAAHTPSDLPGDELIFTKAVFELDVFSEWVEGQQRITNINPVDTHFEAGSFDLLLGIEF